MSVQKKSGLDFKKSGMEMNIDRRPSELMDKKAICQGDIEKVQRFFRMKYGVRLSRKEAERILLVEMRERGGKAFDGRYPRPRPRPR